MFSSSIYVSTGDSHSIVEQANKNSRINSSKSIVIGDHVWIGTNVMMLKGSSVSDIAL